jgi:hypothetical protein
LSTAIAFFEDFVEVGASIDVIERLAGILGVEAADLLRAPPPNESGCKRGRQQDG